MFAALMTRLPAAVLRVLLAPQAAREGAPGCSSQGSQVPEQLGNTPSLCQVSSV